MKRKRNKDVVVTRAWSGRWIDGTIGWSMPRYVSNSFDATVSDMGEGAMDTYVERVEITVRVVRGSDGRSIRRFRGRSQ